MAQITVTFDSFEDMKEFAEKFLGTEKVPVSLGEKEVPAQTQGIPVTPVAPVTPIKPVQSAPVTPVAQPAPATLVQTTPAEQTVPVTPAQPAMSPVPTTERTYSLDELANAAMTLMDKGMQNQLQELLASYGVEALPALPREMYGNFATALRGMGANI
ncbi:hypothetical protein [Anaerobutyricum hallii]|uniref:hypothetical protein n=1 Tax=Anaerobutyricum hallii TaxID=39488 RepID=UPI0026706F90|nr:hypothetical protein [Anaerobutyricum hallii]